MKVLLVDDEQPARERLRRLLASFGELQIVGEAEDGEQAVERIIELQPDLVFLDIQMPGCSGMEVAASLPSPRPKIVFCTAFDEYAVDAFELHAVDYLLKPVNRARLAKAIERVSDQAPEISQTTIGHPTRFLARRGSKYHIVQRDDVLYLSSEGGTTKLHGDGQHYWMQPTLSDLEARLDPTRFLRISRAAIVRLDAVSEVAPQPGGGGELTMANGDVLQVSRRRFKILIERLAELGIVG